MRNSYVNLALPLFVFSEPMPPKYTEDCENDPIMMGPVKAIPGKFSCWDKEHVNGPLTIQQLVDHYKTKYNVELSQITMGPSSLYSSWGNNEGKMGMELIAMYEKIQQGDKVFPPWASCAELVICGETEDGIDCLMPNIVYHIKK